MNNVILLKYKIHECHIIVTGEEVREVVENSRDIWDLTSGLDGFMSLIIGWSVLSLLLLVLAACMLQL